MKPNAVTQLLVCLSLPLALLGQEPVAPHKLVSIIDESFEGIIPDFHTFQATYSVSGANASGGEKSLLIAPESGKMGGVYFRLGSSIAPNQTYEFSCRVLMPADGRASLYISGVDGTARRVFATTSGGEIGKWVTLKAVLHDTDWKGTESDLMLAMVTTTSTYYDEVHLQRIDPVETPIVAWPKAMAQLKAAAAEIPKTLKPGQFLTLRPKHGALSVDLNQVQQSIPTEMTVEIPADGALVFALDLPEAAVVTGALTLKHTGSMRPGLRAYVLMDSILIGAPMLRAPAWSNIGRLIIRPAPEITGEKPSDSVALNACTLRRGLHYLMIAGPHSRSAGEFVELTIKASPVKIHALYSFALISDAHVGEGRQEWMNMKLNGAAGELLKGTLRELNDELVDFAFLAGDMTESGTVAQYTALQQILAESKLKIYGVMGNHETFQPTSRVDRARILRDPFPNNETYYTFDKGPVRFVVLDKSYWRNKTGAISDFPVANEFTANTITPDQVRWFETTLNADRRTPTIVVCHFPFFASPGISSSGYEVVSWAVADRSTTLINSAPNVIATLNGHTHWNQVGKNQNTTWIQNAAFVEWPAMYRVFRVYADHIEWETRLASNLGFLRESFLPEKGLSWMISTSNYDLSGQISFPKN